MQKYLEFKIVKNGFTLLEVIVAIFVIVVALVGGTSAILRALTLTSFSSPRLIATYLAQEGIEITRSIRDTNWLEARTMANPWDEGLNDCSSGCELDYTLLGTVDPNLAPYQDRKLRVDPVNGFYNYITGDETKFKRKVTITKPEETTLNVLIEVSWAEKGVPHSISVQENIYNWR